MCFVYDLKGMHSFFHAYKPTYIHIDRQYWWQPVFLLLLLSIVSFMLNSRKNEHKHTEFMQDLRYKIINEFCIS